MHEIKHPYSPSDIPSSVHDDDKWTPNTSKLAASKNGSDSTAADGLLKNAVQGAHATLDRLADGAAPVAQQLGDGVSAVEETLQAKTNQLRGARDALAESVRNTVRRHPLATIAGAVTLGLVISRLPLRRHPMR